MKFTHIKRAEQMAARVNPSRIIPTTSVQKLRIGGRRNVWVMTPAEIEWRRISDNLDAWNERMGRK